jgi:hypothetical protein
LVILNRNLKLCKKVCGGRLPVYKKFRPEAGTGVHRRSRYRTENRRKRSAPDHHAVLESDGQETDWGYGGEEGDASDRSDGHCTSDSSDEENSAGEEEADETTKATALLDKQRVEKAWQKVRLDTRRRQIEEAPAVDLMRKDMCEVMQAFYQDRVNNVVLVECSHVQHAATGPALQCASQNIQLCPHSKDVPVLVICLQFAFLIHVPAWSCGDCSRTLYAHPASLGCFPAQPVQASDLAEAPTDAKYYAVWFDDTVMDFFRRIEQANQVSNPYYVQVMLSKHLCPDISS